MSASSEPDAAQVGSFSPAGLKVLVVDDDKLCLKVIGKMLQQCSYEVSTCISSAEALATLRDEKNDFDLVLSDVVMPDMDGFKLLEIIGLEMDVPVIMMSYDGDTKTVLKGVTHGAVDFLIKPVRQEELSNMWQHVVRRRRSKATSPSPELADGSGAVVPAQSGQLADDATAGAKLGKRAVPDAPNGVDRVAGHLAAAGAVAGAGPGDGAGATAPTSGGSKRPRVHWTSEMHSQFVAAVNQLGIDKAVPKKILELMTVKGLTRENVASHLQKYRLYLKKAARMDGSHGAQPSTQPALAAQQMPPAGIPTVSPAQTDAAFPQTYVGQPAGMVMQPVYGDSQGYAAPHWQQPVMVTGTPQGVYPQQQAAWQPVVAAPMLGHPHADAAAQQAGGVMYGVPAGGQRSGALSNGATSTLPPLAGDDVDTPMVALGSDSHLGGSDGGVRGGKRTSADTLVFSGMSASFMDDSALGDVGALPEDMEEFLSILAKDAPQEA